MSAPTTTRPTGTVPLFRWAARAALVGLVAGVTVGIVALLN